MAKDKNLITSPRAVVAGFTAIQKATWDFNKTSKEFQIKVAMDAEDAAGFLKKLEKLRDAEFERILEENPKYKKVLKKVDVGTVEYDDEGDETGRIIFKLKQKEEIAYKDKKGVEQTFTKKIALVDSRGKAITAPVKIGSGSVVKVSFEPNPYFSAKDKEVGLSFNRLVGVQLIKLVEFEGDGTPSAEEMGFGAEDDEDGFDASGFTADQNDDPSGDDDEEDF